MVPERDGDSNVLGRQWLGREHPKLLWYVEGFLFLPYFTECQCVIAFFKRQLVFLLYTLICMYTLTRDMLNTALKISLHVLCILDCNDTFLNTLAGSVESPLYPNNYQNSMRCDILIEAPVNYTLMLQFSYFNIEAGDSLQVNYNLKCLTLIHVYLIKHCYDFLIYIYLNGTYLTRSEMATLLRACC